jgi:hypothetical protein
LQISFEAVDGKPTQLKGFLELGDFNKKDKM